MPREGSFERKLKLLVPFLSDLKIGGLLGPLPRSFFPISLDQISEIVILLNTIEQSNNYVFEDDLIPHIFGARAAIYELCLLFIYIISY